MLSRDGPFQTPTLTDKEHQHCHDCAINLLDRTLRSYDERDGQGEDTRPTARLHHSNLDSSRWKLLKTQTDASLYSARPNSVCQDLNLLGGDWDNPLVVLMAGTIRGKLDDIMLGLEIQDTTSYQNRTECFNKHPMDCAIVAKLLGPTDADPFRFLCITWLMYDHKWPIKSMVRPRDFVSVTLAGTMTRANGDRIGYEVMHPVELSKCPPLPGNVIRGRAMHAVIFKQQEPDVVDVFIHAYVETQGVLVDKLSANIVWKLIFGFWEAQHLAELKKLQWCMANCRSESQYRASSLALTVCEPCFTRRSMKKHGNNTDPEEEKSCCVLCGSPTCWKCRTERSLKLPNKSKERLTNQIVVLCQSCLMFVQRLGPVDIARLNYEQHSQLEL